MNPFTTRAVAMIAVVAAAVAIIVAAPADARRAPTTSPGAVTVPTANYARVGSLHCGRIAGTWRAGRVIAHTARGVRFLPLAREARTLRTRARTNPALRTRAARAAQRAAAADRRCVPPSLAVGTGAPANAPITTAPLSTSSLRFHPLAGQRALAIGGSSDFAPGSRSYLDASAGAAPENEGALLTITPDGTPIPSIDAPTPPRVVQTAVAPQGHAYVLLERPREGAGTTCQIVRVPAEGGDGTCVEGGIWVATQGRADLANVTMQTDAWGALYYAGSLMEDGRYVFRRWHDGVRQDLLAPDEVMLMDFLVTPDGRAVISGTHADGSAFTRIAQGADLAPTGARWMRLLDVQGVLQPVLGLPQSGADAGWRIIDGDRLAAPPLPACPSPSDLAVCAGADAVGMMATLTNGTVAGIAPAIDSTPRAYGLWNRQGAAPWTIDDGGIASVDDLIAVGDTLVMASLHGELTLWRDGVTRRIDLGGMTPGALRARGSEVWFDATRGGRNGIGTVDVTTGTATFIASDPIADLTMLP